jgi:hypothetical protein
LKRKSEWCAEIEERELEGAVLPEEVVPLVNAVERYVSGGSTPGSSVVEKSMQVKPADEIAVKDLLVLPGSLPGGVFNADWLSTNDMWVFEVWDLCSEDSVWKISARAVLGTSQDVGILTLGKLYVITLPMSVLTIRKGSPVFRHFFCAIQSYGHHPSALAAGVGPSPLVTNPVATTGSAVTISTSSSSGSSGGGPQPEERLLSESVVVLTPGSSGECLGMQGQVIGSSELGPGVSGLSLPPPQLYSSAQSLNSSTPDSLGNRPSALGRSAGPAVGTQIQGESFGMKRVVDLDGGIWSCRSKASVEEVGKHLLLLRLVEKGRILDFLQDLVLDIQFWRSQLFVWLDSVPLASRLHGALSQVDLVAQTLVSRDDVWFEKFLRGIFSASDWRQLTISQFRADHEREVLWIDRGTPVGRKVLAAAVECLGVLMSVHFDPCFSGALDIVRGFLLDPCSQAVKCHDIFLKVQVDILVAGFFGDVRRAQPHLSRNDESGSCSTPEGCLDLLKLHIAQFLVKSKTWGVAAQADFYVDSRGAKRVILDEGTFKALITQDVWEACVDMYQKRSSAIAHVVPPTWPRVEVLRPTVPHQSIPVSVCLWNIAGLLGVRNLKGVVFSCRKNCSFHRPLKEIKWQEAVDALAQARLNHDSRLAVDNAMKSKKWLFRQ